MARIGRPNLTHAIRFVLLVAFEWGGFSWGVNHAQDYATSVVGTDFDFITADDPSTFKSLAYDRLGKCEMPDKRNNASLWKQAFVFKAQFTDRTRVTIFADATFESKQNAKREAMRYVDPLGRLPTALRLGVRRLVVHRGGETTTAFSDEGLIVIYSGNASKRIKSHDLEETIFHESVHAAWDAKHASSPGWKRAQAADGDFVTMYAKQMPQREDLAETSLFAYTLLHHAERIPKTVCDKLRQTIPHRMAYVGELIPPGQPVHFDVSRKK